MSGEQGSGDDLQATLRDRSATAETIHDAAVRLADQLRLAVAAGRIGTWSWDKATDRTQWDANMERLAGLEPGTFAGTYDAWVGVIHLDDAASSQAVLQAALESGGHYSIEHRFVWPDGSVHWIEGRGMVLHGHDGEVTGAIGCSVDITERKLAHLDSLEVAVRERDRLAFVEQVNAAALAATSTAELLAAVTAAAVPGLGDWCSLHFLAQPGADPQIQVARRSVTGTASADKVIEALRTAIDAVLPMAARDDDIALLALQID